MERAKISLLLQKYLQARLTVEEQRELDEWLQRDSKNQLLIDQLNDEFWLKEQLEIYHTLAQKDEEGESLSLARRIMGIHQQKSRRIFRWIPYAAAAVLLLMISVGVWMSTMPSPEKSISPISELILPGSNQAVLTLSNGQHVTLDENRQGVVMGEHGATYEDGTIIDRTNHSQSFVLSTPKGGTYALVLPDGSKVWLNAASTLRYPAQFEGQERIVELEGEAYFEVSKSLFKKSTQAFVVKSKGQEVKVLGTSFNIAAYAEEKVIQTTLVSGIVEVKSINAEFFDRRMRLEPGQQVSVLNGEMYMKEVETDSYTSWKEGRFSFDGRTFDQIMRELARWYNLEIKYTDEVPSISFYGGAFRNADFQFILDMLESSGVNYQLNGRLLTISSKRKEEFKD